MTNKLNHGQIYYISEAIAEAQKSDLRCKHGSVIVKDGKIVAKGYNKYTGYDRNGGAYANGKWTVHAEADAIHNYTKSNMKNADLYVLRFHDKTNEISNSAPCHSCKELIDRCMKKFKLKKVYYTSYNIEVDEILTK